MTADASSRRLMLTPTLVMLIGVHLALDLALVGGKWHFSQPALMIALAIPLSQLALLAIWAAVAESRTWVRFTLPTGGILACWFLLSLILPWGRGEAASAGWAIALVVQVITTLVLIEYCIACCSARQALQTVEGSERRSNPRFSISTLILWTTVLGIGFGFMQFGQRDWQWTAAVFQWKNMSAMPIIGMTNGMVAALWLWTFAIYGMAKRGVRIIAALALTAGLAGLQYYVTNGLTGTSAIRLDTSFGVLAVQSILISVSLALAETSFR